jgi:ribosomal protein L7/L12
MAKNTYDKALLMAFAQSALASPAVIMLGDGSPATVAANAFAIAEAMLAEYNKLCDKVDAATLDPNEPVFYHEGKPFQLVKLEIDLLKQYKKIYAIKELRTRLGASSFGLAAAKHAVEQYCAVKGIGAQVDLSPAPVATPFLQEFLEDLPIYTEPISGKQYQLNANEILLCHENKKITAIKEARIRTGLMLKEAKDMVEQYIQAKCL